MFKNRRRPEVRSYLPTARPGSEFMVWTISMPWRWNRVNLISNRLRHRKQIVGCCYLVENHPVGVNLWVTLWVQHYSLIGPEVSQGDLSVLRAVVDYINNIVFVKVSFTCISNFIIWKTHNNLHCTHVSTQTVVEEVFRWSTEGLLSLKMNIEF